MPDPIDLRNSSQWAISKLEGEGAVGATRTLFDLVNAHTGRGHRMELYTGGFGLGLIPVSFALTASRYVYFQTPRPANFTDFDNRAGQLASGSVGLYAVANLIVWDGSYGARSRLIDIGMKGWGISSPGGYNGIGVTNMVYGNGIPVRNIWTIPDNPDIPVKEPTTVHAVYVSHEKLEFELAGDALFPFDRPRPGERYHFDHNAVKTLEYAGGVIQSRPGLVRVVGYTDSKGGEAYNQSLSERRAAAVKDWFVEHKYVDAVRIQSFGNGSKFPNAPNTKPDGSDDPVGRAQNRRVEIVIDRR